MEGTSDDEVKWDLQSSGDEGGTATEAPAQVQAKPKKARSKGQLAAFEKARAARAANILKKKEAKRAPAPVEQPPPLKKKKKQRVVFYEESSEQEASSSDEDVLLVRRRKKPKPKPMKKPKRKPRIVYESDLDSSSGDDSALPSASKVSVPAQPQFYVY